LAHAPASRVPVQPKGCRKKVDEIFGWSKTVGVLRKARYRGVAHGLWAYLVGKA
jgi:hypothetical protein